jgi:hypothetical protein
VVALTGQIGEEKHVTEKKWLGLGILAGFVAAMICVTATAVLADDAVGVMLTGEGGFFAVVGPDKEATVLNGLGAGIAYCPLVKQADGTVRASRLTFTILGRQGDPNVGKVGALCRFAEWEGVAFSGGVSALGIGNDLNAIELGGTVDVGLDFDIGDQALQIRVAGGYLTSSRYPISASIGYRTP